MNQQQQDRWAQQLLTETLGIAWHDSDPQARRVADAAAKKVADQRTSAAKQERDEAQQSIFNLLQLLADIRQAAGDPKAKLMQPELIARIREQRQVLEQIRTDMRRHPLAAIDPRTLDRLTAVLGTEGNKS